MNAFGVTVAGLVGGVVGSFLNVVIWRVPRRESLITPGSHCPRCDRPIRWFDNIPVLSWVLLGAKCRACRAPIPWRYPAVEALTALLFVLAAQRLGDSPKDAAAIALLLAGLVSITFIDIDHRIIPDAITKPGMVLAVILAPLTTLHPPDWIQGLRPGLNQLLHATAGVLLGLAIIWGVRLLGTLLFRKEAMGLGDAKLLGLIGGFTGPGGTLYALLVACVGGSLVHGLVVLLTRSKAKPLLLEIKRPGQGVMTFDRAWVRLDPLAAGPAGAGAPVLEVEGEYRLDPGDGLQARLVLPKVRVLMDVDVVVQAKAVVLAGVASGRRRVRLDGLTPEELEHLAFFADSHRYLPFGPYLALGGVVVALFSAELHRALTGWQHLVR